MILLRPSPGNITNPYSASHRALDFGWGNGTTVVAAHAGKVSIDRTPGYGLRLSIVSATHVTRYAHLSIALVAAGGHARAGQEIAVQGNSGSFAEYVHLHFELLQRVGSGLAKINPGPFTTPALEAPPTPLPQELGEKDMFILKPSSSSNSFPNAPVARILTDLRHTEVVTSKARIAVIDFTSSRTDGPPTLVVDRANWEAYAALPGFPEVVTLTPDDRVHIANLIAANITVPTKGTITLTQ